MESNTIDFKEVESKIILIREQQVILDKDVAELYGVTTKEINQAVKNNPEKFPEGYVFPLSTAEFDYLRSKILTTKFNKTRVLPKAFTERGLYMLATILKSPSATTTTMAIIETFINLRELTRTVSELAITQDNAKQKTLLQKSGELFSDLIDDGSLVTTSETTIELNLAVLKLKHTVKRGIEKE